MEDNPLKVIDLDNNTVLKVYDRSRKIAGDRWFLSIAVQVEISVHQLNSISIEGYGTINPDDMVRDMGDVIIFEQKIERNFVDNDQKDLLFEQLLESYLKNSTAYLSHKNFPIRYASKTYRDYLEKQKWYK